jgi:hypothetical protein
MKRILKSLIGMAIVIFLVTAYSSQPIGVEIASAASKYIEVCNNGTVHVPPGTKFVTCHGRVMRVIAIVPIGEGTKGAPVDCNCPKCCEGACGVTVTCPNGGLCVMFLSC